jgi:antitoxin StbD
MKNKSHGGCCKWLRKGKAIALLNHNAPAFYCVPADMYEAMLEQLDDLELLSIVEARKDEGSIFVTLDNL